jgi:hypothetical protein
MLSKSILVLGCHLDSLSTDTILHQHAILLATGLKTIHDDWLFDP